MWLLGFELRIFGRAVSALILLTFEEGVFVGVFGFDFYFVGFSFDTGST